MTQTEPDRVYHLLTHTYRSDSHNSNKIIWFQARVALCVETLVNGHDTVCQVTNVRHGRVDRSGQPHRGTLAVLQVQRKRRTEHQIVVSLIRRCLIMIVFQPQTDIVREYSHRIAVIGVNIFLVSPDSGFFNDIICLSEVFILVVPMFDIQIKLE